MDVIKTKKVIVTDEEWIKYRALNTQVIEQGESCPADVFKKWQSLRNSIASKFYFLACRGAEGIHAKNKHVEVDELTSWGVDGLYEAIDSYDITRISEKTGKPIKFETFAPRRITGAILDWIRRNDDVPRLTRYRAKQIKAKQEKLEAKLGRPPTEDEMAKAFKLSLEDYQKMLKNSQTKATFSLDVSYSGDGDGGNGGGDGSMIDGLCDSRVKHPLTSMETEELQSKLLGKNFTPVDRKIIFLYYYEDRTMKEISDILNLSESRVSQLHSALLKRLKEVITRNPEFFEDYLKMFTKKESPAKKVAKGKAPAKKAMA